MLMYNYIVNTLIIGYPKLYLGAGIGNVENGNGSYSCTMSLDFCVKEAIRNVNRYMKDDNMEFSKKLSDINYSPKNTFYEV